MFERFSRNARRVITGGVEIAAEDGTAKAGPEHLLLGLATDEQSLGARVLAEYGVTAAVLRAAATAPPGRAGLTDAEITALRAVGVDAEEVFRLVEEAFGPDAWDGADQPQPPRRRGHFGAPVNQQAKKVIELGLREAVALRHREINSGHLLLALLRHGVTGPMSTVLTEHGVTYDDARRRVLLAQYEAA
ncbi:Clp protease N-terminal domain-containing protein [Micromonospora sp. NBC_01796]|uniref:Clp protease N-terminal domain-containing protein n=1 Tax=Micromonospora sp. NBC_01796 TaxID=2975987 RepID=UPI002DD941C5|nr:Clp protease N-terminal domain-containing protein [Micromonospora sp. NBC_01796]WSA83727.1 Clp protease [Micromonospora sp. NBC_01796]